jgi:hypothetical protein
VTSEGTFVIYDGVKWSAPTAISTDPTNPHPNLTSISCRGSLSGKATLCATSDSSGFAFFVSLVKGIITIKPTGGVSSGFASGHSFVACNKGVTLTCTETNAAGDVRYWNGTMWNSGEQLFLDGGTSEIPVTGLSCSPSGLCVAIDSHRGATTFAATGPLGKHRPTLLYVGGWDSTSISCPTNAYCVAGDRKGHIYQGVSNSDIISSRTTWAQIQPFIKNSGVIASCAGSFTSLSPLGCRAIALKSGVQWPLHASQVIEL